MMIVVALEDGTVKTHEGMIEVGADAHLRIIHGTTQAIQAVYAPGRWQWAEEVNGEVHGRPLSVQLQKPV